CCGTTPSGSWKLTLQWHSAVIGNSIPSNFATSFCIGPAASTTCDAWSDCGSPASRTERTRPPGASMPTTRPLTSLTPRDRAATSFGRARHLMKKRDFPGIAGRKHIAAAIEIDAVVGCVRDPLDQVDAAVHECGHRPIRARPPIAIGLGRLVGGERKRIAGLD